MTANTDNFRIPVVIVTGGTRGIGKAIVNEFREQGANVIATGTHADEIKRLNDQSVDGLIYLLADFTDPESLEQFCRYISSLPNVDVLVNNAGINIIKHVNEVTAEDFDQVTAINYRAPYLLSQAAVRVMQQQRSGKIINIGSIWSVITKQGRSPYVASKAGLAGMTRALATDLAEFNILVNCVSPGFVMTDLTQHSLTQTEIDQLAQQVPLGRFADPQEIARLVAFLGSEKNTYITGQNIVIDGGFTHV